MKKIFLLLLFISQTCGIMLAQQAEIDSLKLAAQVGQIADSNKITIYNALGRKYLYLSTDSSRKYSEMAFALAKAISGGEKEMAVSQNNIGAVFYLKGDLDSAFHYWNTSLTLREKIGDRESQITILNNMGLVLWKRGDLYEALDRFQNALIIAESIDHKKFISGITLNMGNIFEHQRRFGEALEHYFRSVEIKRQIADHKGTCTALNNIGNVFVTRKELQEARKYFLESLRMADSIPFPMAKAIALSNLGNIAVLERQYQKAMDIYETALALSEELQLKNEIAEVYLGMAEVYHATDKPKRAKNHALKAYALAEQMGTPKLIYRCAGLLMDIFEKDNKPREALNYARIHLEAKDQIYDAEKTWEVSKLIFELEKEKFKAAAEIERLNEQLGLEDSLALERFKKDFYLGVGLLLLVFAISFYITLQRLRQKNLLLQRQQEKITTINRLLQDNLLSKEAYLEQSRETLKNISRHSAASLKTISTRIQALIAVFEFEESTPDEKQEAFQRVKQQFEELEKELDKITSKIQFEEED